jgi:hypothetical protein
MTKTLALVTLKWVFHEGPNTEALAIYYHELGQLGARKNEFDVQCWLSLFPSGEAENLCHCFIALLVDLLKNFIISVSQAYRTDYSFYLTVRHGLGALDFIVSKSGQLE